MRLLLANKFFHLRGGAEKVFFEEAALLAAKGHQVGYFSMHHPLNRPSQYSRYFVSQVDYERPPGFSGGLRAAGRLLYSFEARARLRRVERHRARGQASTQTGHSPHRTPPRPQLQQTAENNLKTLIGDAEIGTLPSGVSYSWKVQEKKEYVVKASRTRMLRRKG